MPPPPNQAVLRLKACVLIPGFLHGFRRAALRPSYLHSSTLRAEPSPQAPLSV